MKLRTGLLLVGLPLGLAALCLTIPNADGQSEAILHSFAAFRADGQAPHAVLVQGSDGNLYGTTRFGGTHSHGTVFRISLSGTYTSLYSFGRVPYDGASPIAGLIQGSDGNFYGTTDVGGTNNAGTVFRISPTGTYTSLYSFGSYPTDGERPYAELVQGSDGNFYGTTDVGGAGTNCSGIEGIGCGTVFRISPSGTETTIYSFANSPDGYNPFARLLQGSDGNFYGTTTGGGTNSCECGTVFRISPSGTETTLYSFAGPPHDGAFPEAGLVQDSDGNFYGTSFYGGTNNAGTVFRISPSGTETTLYSFAGPPNDGTYPVAGLVQAVTAISTGRPT